MRLSSWTEAALKPATHIRINVHLIFNLIFDINSDNFLYYTILYTNIFNSLHCTLRMRISMRYKCVYKIIIPGWSGRECAPRATSAFISIASNYNALCTQLNAFIFIYFINPICIDIYRQIYNIHTPKSNYIYYAYIFIIVALICAAQP